MTKEAQCKLFCRENMYWNRKKKWFIIFSWKLLKTLSPSLHECSMFTSVPKKQQQQENKQRKHKRHLRKCMKSQRAALSSCGWHKTSTLHQQIIKTYSSEAQQKQKGSLYSTELQLCAREGEHEIIDKSSEASSARRSHCDAKQCKETTTKDPADQGLHEMLIIQTTKKLTSDATTQKEQQRRESERKDKLLFERWDAGSEKNTWPLSMTPTQRGCSDGSGCCQVDTEEAEHSGWWHWVRQCQVSFWHVYPP